MTSTQRVIKYFGFLLAILLIISIFSGIYYGVSAISSIFTKNNEILTEFKEMKINKETKLLELDVKAATININSGSTLKIETNNDSIKVTEDNYKIIVKDNSKNRFKVNPKTEINITIPTDYIFEGINIETGAGKLFIDSLKTEVLSLDLGAGKVEINNLVVSKKGSIDTGAGEFIIKNGSLNDIEFDLGTGKTDIKSLFTGSSTIDAGIGELNLNLLSDINMYELKIDKGLGSISLNEESIKSGTYGNGINKIDISSGIGSINITTNNNR